MTEPNRVVGERIKCIRESKNVSREEVSERSGLTPEQITRIEENLELPALALLLKIARALGVRLGTFLDGQEESGPVLCRKAEREKKVCFSTHSAQAKRHMEYHSLSGSKSNRHMEPFMIDIEPAAESDFVWSSHEGEEFILVMEGTVEVNYGKNSYLLKPGDNIYYDSIVPHHVHASGDEKARIMAVVYIPV